MDSKIKIAVEPREGLVHHIVVEEDVLIRSGQSLTIEVGRDGEVASLILHTTTQVISGGGAK